MKTKLLLLVPSITLALLSVSGTGCRTASSTETASNKSLAGLRLNSSTIIRVRIPEQGRYCPTLFQKPVVIPPKDAPANWTGEWIKSDESMMAIRMGPYGSTALPMVIASGIHSFFGTALYKILPTTSNYSRKAMMDDVNAIVAAARERQFEQDLKQAVIDQLRREGAVAVDAGSSPTPSHARASHVVTIDLYLVTAGMTRGGSFNQAANPAQRFHLDVRAEVSGAAETSAILRLNFDSESARFRDWAADGASRFAAVRGQSLQTVAAELAGQLTSRVSRDPVPAETYLASQP